MGAARKLVNYEFIEEEFDGLEDILGKVLKVFGNEYPTLLNDIKVASDSKDPVELRKAAHTIKGALRGIGGDQLATIAEKIELKSDESDIEAVQALFADLKNQVPDLHQELLDYLQSKTGSSDPAENG